jgi:Na+/melibiose symporter-like transporter
MSTADGQQDKRNRVQTMTSSLLISLLITFLVIILVLYLINMLPIDGRAKQIARVIVIVIGIISLLRYLAVF